MFGLEVVGGVLDVVVVIAVVLIDGVTVVGDWVVTADAIVAAVEVRLGRVVVGGVVETPIEILVGGELVDNGANVSMSVSVVLSARFTVVVTEVVVSTGVTIAVVGKVVAVVVSFGFFVITLYGREL